MLARFYKLQLHVLLGNISGVWRNWSQRLDSSGWQRQASAGPGDRKEKHCWHRWSTWKASRRSACSQVDNITHAELLTWAWYRAEVKYDRKSRDKKQQHLPQDDSQTQDTQKATLFCSKNILVFVCWKRKLYLFLWPLDLVFLWAVAFPLKFLTALCQRSRVSGLSEVSNAFSFALIWLKSDECVTGRLRNVQWNCTWGSGFSGRKEIYEGDGGVTLSFLRFSLNPSHKLQNVCILQWCV